MTFEELMPGTIFYGMTDDKLEKFEVCTRATRQVTIKYHLMPGQMYNLGFSINCRKVLNMKDMGKFHIGKTPRDAFSLWSVESDKKIEMQRNWLNRLEEDAVKAQSAVLKWEEENAPPT